MVATADCPVDDLLWMGKKLIAVTHGRAFNLHSGPIERFGFLIEKQTLCGGLNDVVP
jgi:hypothetical protein